MREHLSPPSSRAWGQPEARKAESQCSVFWDALYGLCCDATKTLTAVQKLKPQPIEAESGLTAWSGASLKKKKKKKQQEHSLQNINRTQNFKMSRVQSRTVQYARTRKCQQHVMAQTTEALKLSKKK